MSLMGVKSSSPTCRKHAHSCSSYLEGGGILGSTLLHFFLNIAVDCLLELFLHHYGLPCLGLLWCDSSGWEGEWEKLAWTWTASHWAIYSWWTKLLINSNNAWNTISLKKEIVHKKGKRRVIKAILHSKAENVTSSAVQWKITHHLLLSPAAARVLQRKEPKRVSPFLLLHSLLCQDLQNAPLWHPC